MTRPRCPDCRWHLEFTPGLGIWLARCWNKACERGRSRVPLTPREAGLSPDFFAGREKR